MINFSSLKAISYKLEPSYAWALVVVLSCAFVSFFINLQFGVFALLFSIVAWWCWLNPTSAFFTLIVLSSLLPMFKVTQSIGLFTLIKDIVILTLFARLIAWPLLNKKLPYRRNILVVPIIALIAWLAVALLMADSITLGILRAREIGLYVLLYLVTLYIPKNKNFYKELLFWVLTTLFSVLVIALYQWFFAIDSAVLRFDPVRSIWIPRISSTFGHPSVFGQTLIIASTLLLGLFFAVKKVAHKASLAVGLIILALCIYLTYSRAVWLGLVAAFASIALVLLYKTYGRERSLKRALKPTLALVVASIATLFILWNFTTVGTFLSSSIDANYKSNSIRLEFVTRLIAPMTNVQALFGRGLGDVISQNFRDVGTANPEITSNTSRSVQLAKDNTLVDNQLLKTFVEMGLAGILIYFWIYWRIGRTAVQLITTRVKESEQQRLLILGILGLGSLVAFILQAAFIDIWDIYPTNAWFWIIAGFISTEAIWVNKKVIK